jgi:hypothetical protein
MAKRKGSHYAGTMQFYGITKAMNASGEIVDVEDVRRGKGCDCFCLSCNAPVVARKGDIRMHHFAHVSGMNLCAYGLETSLCYVAKELYNEAGYVMAPPVTLNLHGKGIWTIKETQKIEIAEVVIDKATYSKPHLLVTTKDGHKLCIEISVKNKIDDAKLKLIIEHAVPTMEINLSTIDQEIDRDALADLLINQITYKEWKYSRLSAKWEKEAYSYMCKQPIQNRKVVCPFDESDSKTSIEECRFCPFVVDIPKKLTSDDACVLCDPIMNLQDFDDLKSRVKHDKESHGEGMKIAKGVCPECGGRLVKREGPYGTFIGCSNYNSARKCTFTISILDDDDR